MLQAEQRLISRSLPRIVQVTRKPPAASSFEVNTDGSSSNPGKGGVGAIIQDEKGEWVRGSYRHAELWVLRYGLSLFHQLNIPHLEIEI
ncbi:hypothetical protein J1N35_013470 [Gossypium stocksii]|uniref:RNase H type-1 domain-containing protein n=1 Tax=Gossypium stocksii TaxID=47602 RepID=A0A9D3VU53_9ROSI|nr:hypothetical protein J1N35_013470 [Gossypium stocksii]